MGNLVFVSVLCYSFPFRKTWFQQELLVWLINSALKAAVLFSGHISAKIDQIPSENKARQQILVIFEPSKQDLNINDIIKKLTGTAFILLSYGWEKQNMTTTADITLETLPCVLNNNNNKIKIIIIIIILFNLKKQMYIIQRNI